MLIKASLLCFGAGWTQTQTQTTVLKRTKTLYWRELGNNGSGKNRAGPASLADCSCFSRGRGTGFAGANGGVGSARTGGGTGCVGTGAETGCARTGTDLVGAGAGSGSGYGSGSGSGPDLAAGTGDLDAGTGDSTAEIRERELGCRDQGLAQIQRDVLGNHHSGFSLPVGCLYPVCLSEG